MTAPEAVLCIPGTWTNLSDLGDRIMRDSGGYLYAGRILMHMDTKAAVELQFEAADPRVVTAFGYAGRHWEGTADMARIADHTAVVYLIGKGGAEADAETLMLAADGLLKAGGLGVKVESSGIAHRPAAWHGFVENRHLGGAHNAFVLYLTGTHVTSCGMHHFGLPEAVVDPADADDPAELLRVFTRYLLVERSVISAGQTFSTAEHAPAYRIVEGASVDYGSDSLFNNPYGMWRLEPVAAGGGMPKKRASWRELFH
jgi:hypothetical protein